MEVLFAQELRAFEMKPPLNGSNVFLQIDDIKNLWAQKINTGFIGFTITNRTQLYNGGFCLRKD